MFPPLLAAIMIALCPLVSATVSAGFALAPLVQHLQQCTHELSTTVHLPDTTVWSSRTYTAIDLPTTPKDAPDPGYIVLHPTIALTIGGDIPDRIVVEETSISIQARPSQEPSASSSIVIPSSRTHAASLFTQHLGQCTHALSTVVELSDTMPWSAYLPYVVGTSDTKFLPPDPVASSGPLGPAVPALLTISDVVPQELSLPVCAVSETPPTFTNRIAPPISSWSTVLVPLTLSTDVPAEVNQVIDTTATRPSLPEHLRSRKPSDHAVAVPPPPGHPELDEIDQLAVSSTTSSGSLTWPSCAAHLPSDLLAIDDCLETSDIYTNHIFATKEAVVEPQRSWLRSILGHFTMFCLLVCFIICWFSVGLYIYTIGTFFPSSSAAGSVERCAAVFDAGYDGVNIRGPSCRWLGESIRKTWHIVKKAITSKLFSSQLPVISLLAPKFAMATVRWLANVVRNAWQYKKAIPAELILMQVPAYSAFAVNFVLAFFRYHPMSGYRSKAFHRRLESYKHILPSSPCWDLVVRRDVTKASVKHAHHGKQNLIIDVLSQRGRDLVVRPRDGSTKFLNVNTNILYLDQAAKPQQTRGVTVRPQNLWAKAMEIDTDNQDLALAVRKPNHIEMDPRLPVRAQDFKNITVYQEPLFLVVDPKLFMFALELALQAPKYRTNILWLVNMYLKISPKQVKRLSAKMAALEKNHSVQLEEQKVHITRYWNRRVRRATNKFVMAKKDLEVVHTYYNWELTREREQKREAEEKSAKSATENAELTTQLQKQTENNSKMRNNLITANKNREHATQKMEEKLEVHRDISKTHLAQIHTLTAEKQQAIMDCNNKQTELDEANRKVENLEHLNDLLREDSEQREKSEAEKGRRIAELVEQLKECNKAQSDLGGAKKERAQGNAAATVLRPEVENHTALEAEHAANIDLPRQLEECQLDRDAKTSNMNGATIASESKDMASRVEPKKLSTSTWDDMRLLDKGLEAWDDDFYPEPTSAAISPPMSTSRPKELVDLETADAQISNKTLGSFQDNSYSEKLAASLAVSSVLGSLPAPLNTKGTMNLVGTDINKDAHCGIETSELEAFQFRTDFFEADRPLGNQPIVNLPRSVESTKGIPANGQALIQVEPPCVSSKDILVIDASENPKFSFPTVTSGGNAINEDSQLEDSAQKGNTISVAQEGSRPAYKKFHFRNRGQKQTPNRKPANSSKPTLSFENSLAEFDLRS